MERKIIVNTLQVFFFCSWLFLPSLAHAATLSFSPPSSTFEVGDLVTIKVMVSSSAPINAVSGSVLIPASLFSVESISKSGSILNFWVSEPSFARGSNTLTFEGVALGGFSGGTGSVITMELRALSSGSGVLTFTSGQVLANDGQGTNVTSALNKAVFSVEPKKEIIVDPVVLMEVETEEEAGASDEDEDVVEEEVTQELALRAPEIVLSRRVGENMIEGSSDYARAQVLLTFVSDTGEKVFVMGDTDDNGDFVFSIPSSLKSGDYTISAVVIREDLTYSPPSNTVDTTVGSIFSDISSEMRVYIGILLLVLMYLLVRNVFMFVRNKNIRNHIDEETEEAKDILRRSFKVLKSDIKRGMKDAGDKEIFIDLKEDLGEAEELISKEIEDIRKVQ